MVLVLKYSSFCIIAMLVNLLTQRFFIESSITENSYVVALIMGTVAGLFIKFLLDKNFIFNDLNDNSSNKINKFPAYTLNSVFTTLIFWGTESLFYFLGGTNFFREIGAILGLTIGYIIKYRMDKRFVFSRNQGLKHTQNHTDGILDNIFYFDSCSFIFVICFISFLKDEH